MDCDDDNGDVHPEAPELCNGVDDDCDEVIDEEDALDATTWYVDGDRDGHGDPDGWTVSCQLPPDHTDRGTDCDDSRDDVNPDADERCDGVDNNCDTVIDEDTAVDAPLWFADSDTDGSGDPDVSRAACAAPSGMVADDTDCDDAAADVHPGATELCNLFDDDCDGTVDESDADDAVDWYADGDGDGYGDPAVVTHACFAPSGSLADNTDCDDAAADVHPGATELCNLIDDDCDGTVDEPDADDAVDWYADGDGDGYGDPAVVTHACVAPSGSLADNTDCDDAAADVHPGATETCNSVDDDCDGTIDGPTATDAALWFADSDGDGFGDSTTTTLACTAPTGTSSDATDCDDTDARVFPDADELCWDGIDHDCDGLSTTDSECAPEGTFTHASQDALLAASTAGAGLGSAIAAGDHDFDGDDDVLVGLPGLSGGGGAWLVLGDPAFGSTAVTVQISPPSGASAFGAATAVGDLDGDGLAELIVGDPTTSTGASYGGGVLVFPGNASPALTLSASSATTTISGTSSSGRLGSRLATGDLNGDGLDDLAVSSPYATALHGNATQVGQVALWMGGPPSGSTTAASADQTWVGELEGDLAGQGLAIASDVDGDGLDDLIIGAPSNDTADWDAGAVYVVLGPATGRDGRLSLADVILRGETEDDGFGSAVAGAGDINADGYGDLIIGVPGDDAGGTDAGGAVLFFGPLQTGRRLSAADADGVLVGEAAGDEAGTAVAGGGDTDGDGYADVLVGGPDHDQGGSNAGAVWMVRGPLSVASLDLSLATWELEAAAGDGLGEAVAFGDMNGDRYTDVFTGAPDADSGASNVGELGITLGGPRVQTPTVPTVPSLTDDADGDGTTEVDGDCDDTRSTVGPSATETCGDGIDQDCDGIDQRCALGATLDLLAPDALVSGDRSCRTGEALAYVGDLNDDGWDDLGIGDPNDSAVDIWFGPLADGPRATDTPDLRIEGPYGTGEAIGRAGDVNSDGIDDLIIGSPDSSDTWTTGGNAYILFGDAALLGTLTFPGDADVVIEPESSGDALGTAVVGGADLNGDGIDDVAVGAPTGTGAIRGEGVVYVFFGGRAAGTWTASGADLIIGGESYSDEVGGSLDIAGDIDADGFVELLIGAKDQIESRGAAYLLWGPLSSGFIDLSTERTRFVGSDYTGSRVSGVGDVDGDGYDDLAISSPASTSTAGNAGEVGIFFGPVGPAWYGMADADVIITGDAAGDQFGLGLASGGDLDGDGYADLAIGAPTSDAGGSSSGGAWIFYGPLTSGTLTTSDADVSVPGYWSNIQAGTALALDGDIDGDGVNDLVVSAPEATLRSTHPWAAYSYGGLTSIFYGGARSASVHSPVTPSLTDDADGDGFTETDGDCDDTRAAVYPGATEVCEDRLDGDCDGIELWCPPSGAVAMGSNPGIQEASNYAVGADAALVDLDGDGYDDLVVGASKSRSGSGDGAVYVMWAPLARGTLNLSTSHAPDLTIHTTTSSGALGSAVAEVDDMNLDGVADLLVGASGTGLGGEALLLLGPVTGGMEADGATVAEHTFTAGAVGDGLGGAASSGDVDGDGIPDLLIAASGEDTAATGAGAIYLVLGPVTAGTSSISSADATWTGTSASEGLGVVEVVGDIDGDGNADVVMGGPGAEGSWGTFGSGRAYLWKGGTPPGTVSASTADVVFEAEASGNGAGASAGPAGDIDGDGVVDLIIGATAVTATWSRGGAGYLFYSAGALSGTVDLGTADVRILGGSSNALTGAGVGTAGDMDGDGYDELLIGSTRESTMYLFQGPLSTTGDIGVGAADASFTPWGDVYTGRIGDPGDQDGDGYNDVMVMGPQSFGRVYVVPGGE